jgi:phage baseplate assembly protein W
MATVAENSGASTRPSDEKSSDQDLVGIAFPFRKEAGEFPARAKNKDAVKSDLITLFNTPKGSRRMRPNYGSNKEILVFESTGPLLRARLERNIRQTIFNSEPRIKVRGIAIQEQKTKVIALIVYIVQGVRDSIQLEIDRLDV